MRSLSALLADNDHAGLPGGDDVGDRAPQSGVGGRLVALDTERCERTVVVKQQSTGGRLEQRSEKSYPIGKSVPATS